MCLIQKSHPCPDKIADPMANGTYYDAASGMVWSAYSCMTPRYEAYTTIPYFVKSPAPNVYDSPNISVSITNPSTCYPMKVFSHRFVQLCLGSGYSGYNGVYIDLMSSSDLATYGGIRLQHPFRTGPFLESPHWDLTEYLDEGFVAAGDTAQRGMRLRFRDNPQDIGISGAYGITFTGTIMQQCGT